MPLDGFSRSRGYLGLQKGWGRGQLYAFELSDGVYKRKKVTAQEGGGAQKLGDVSYAVPRRLHTLAFTGGVGRLRGPRSRNGLDDRHSNLLSIRCNGAASQGSEGDK